jgi:hypothetical protein
MKYSPRVKGRRMQCVVDDIDAGDGPGVLQIGTAGMERVLVEISLARPCGAVENARLVFADLPRSGRATGRGSPAAARILNSSGEVVVDELTAGPDDTDADVIVDRRVVSIGQVVVIDAPFHIQHA